MPDHSSGTTTFAAGARQRACLERRSNHFDGEKKTVVFIETASMRAQVLSTVTRCFSSSEEDEPLGLFVAAPLRKIELIFSRRRVGSQRMGPWSLSLLCEQIPASKRTVDAPHSQRSFAARVSSTTRGLHWSPPATNQDAVGFFVSRSAGAHQWQ
jgi:hypothetical protein